MNQSLRNSFFVLTALTLSSMSHAKSMARDIGAGLSFPSSNQALYVNSSALTEGNKMSLQGLWDFEGQQPTVSIAGAQQKFGWALGWMDRSSQNRFDGGFGFAIGALNIGTNMYTYDFDGLDGDVSATLDLSKIRLVAAIRQVQDGIDRLDLGLGFNVEKMLISLDVYKIIPWSLTDIYGVDASLAYNTGSLSFGVGYDFIFNSGVENGEIHGGVSIAVSSKASIEGHYRLTPLNSSAIGEWSAGAKFKL